MGVLLLWAFMFRSVHIVVLGLLSHGRGQSRGVLLQWGCCYCRGVLLPGRSVYRTV